MAGVSKTTSRLSDLLGEPIRLRIWLFSWLGVIMGEDAEKNQQREKVQVVKPGEVEAEALLLGEGGCV